MNDFDGVVRALSDSSRRQILVALREEEDIHPFPSDVDERDRSLQLHHVHLPLLEEQDIVDWNRDTGTVRRGEDFDAIEPLLAALDDQERELPDGYLPDEGQRC